MGQWNFECGVIQWQKKKYNRKIEKRYIKDHLNKILN
jgi:hypothetical protein